MPAPTFCGCVHTGVHGGPAVRARPAGPPTGSPPRSRRPAGCREDHAGRPAPRARRRGGRARRGRPPAHAALRVGAGRAGGARARRPGGGGGGGPPLGRPIVAGPRLLPHLRVRRRRGPPRRDGPARRGVRAPGRPRRPRRPASARPAAYASTWPRSREPRRPRRSAQSPAHRRTCGSSIVSTGPPRGNPFFAEELVAAGDGAHLRGILLARVDRLGDDAKAVLRVALSDRAHRRPRSAGRAGRDGRARARCRAARGSRCARPRPREGRARVPSRAPPRGDRGRAPEQ